MCVNNSLHDLADDDFCYVTTTGRRSGRPHTIEIWFALRGHTIYLLSGGRDRADWVRNALKQPEVQVRIREQSFTGKARLVSDEQEDALARQLAYNKYAPRDSDDLSDWSRSSLPIAVDLII